LSLPEVIALIWRENWRGIEERKLEEEKYIFQGHVKEIDQ
jgi:hypothetical protein